MAVSMGIVTTDAVPPTVEDLVHRADELMYGSDDVGQTPAAPIGRRAVLRSNSTPC
jgi:hypothetical protein